MAGDNLRETAHPRATPDQEDIGLSHQPSGGAATHQPEYNGLLATGFVLLVALVIIVHLLVIYRS